MAHFAQLDENNVVLQVIVINNDVIVDENGIEREQLGIDFCKSLYGEDTKWIQTSYNGKIRFRYASIGYTYNDILNAFVVPQPYPSWLFDEETADWYPPVPYPITNGGSFGYYWDEPTISWKPIVIEEV